MALGKQACTDACVPHCLAPVPRNLCPACAKAMQLNPTAQIRTAAVTTTPDGLVRDVFEVRMDDETLQPDEVQNLVHEVGPCTWGGRPRGC